MALALRYDAGKRAVTLTVYDGYLDRLSRWSDIQEYLPLLHDAARSCPQARILELGARRGNSTLAFLAGAKQSGGHVWSADIDDVRKLPDGMGPWRHLDRWTFIQGDDMDPAIQARLPAEVDILFVDTSHEYGHTLAELRAYMPRVARGGVALFHDTRILGTWSEPGDTVPPVARALDDWCEETGLSWENLPGEYGLGVVRVPL